MAMSGRPPKHPKKKVGRPVRFLVTPGIEVALIEAAKLHGIKYRRNKLGIPTVPSDILRLYLIAGLKKDALWKDEFDQDPTFEELRLNGLA